MLIQPDIVPLLKCHALDAALWAASPIRVSKKFAFTRPEFSVPKSRMKLLVVIANYRVAHLTIDCLRSIATEIGSVAENRVAVCENGTGDDFVDESKRPLQKMAGVHGAP